MPDIEYRIDFHPLIEKDFSDAYHWYESHQKGLGERFLDAMRLKVAAIQENPEAFSVKYKKDHREATITGFPYLIVYKIYKRSRSVFVCSISHSKRHPSKKIRKR